MKLNTYSLPSINILLLLLLLSTCFELGLCRVGGLINMKKFGGVDQCRGKQELAEIESIGRFAVDEYNAKKNVHLEFSTVIKSAERVTAGTMYYLTVEVIEDGKKNVYVANVWAKPWINFRELLNFELAADDDVTTTNSQTA